MLTGYINGFSCLNLTKLDVLDEEESIPVGISTDAAGTVEYRTMPGWKTSTRGIREWSKLPKEAKQYVEFIEEWTKVPVRMIGTGQSREDIIIR